MRRVNLEPGKQATNLVNVARFVLRHPANSGVLVRKVLDRLIGRKRNAASAENTAWINAHSQDPGDVGRRIAPEIWEEAEEFASSGQEYGRLILEKIPVDMGGGGDFQFLYWLTRLIRPRVVVETGVAAGWTSRALLAALRQNGRGQLYSSDFPYFRINDPKKHIGCLVEPELRARWKLYLDGDDRSLPEIVAQVPSIDIFHYDSDKSWAGREKAIELIRPKMSADGLILMDDILENGWFKSYVERERTPFTIIGGRVGLIGQIKTPARS